MQECHSALVEGEALSTPISTSGAGKAWQTGQDGASTRCPKKGEGHRGGGSGRGGGREARHADPGAEARACG